MMESANVSTEELQPGDRVKTRGREIVEVYSVRHFNDTVSVGKSRKFPLLISVDEIAEIISKAE